MGQAEFSLAFCEALALTFAGRHAMMAAPMYVEPKSPVGCSAADCVTHAIEHEAGAYSEPARHYQTARAKPPRACDALGPDVCLRCGMTTETAHADPLDCIDALRSKLAVAEK